MTSLRSPKGYGPDESEEREDTLDPTEVSEAFLAEIEGIHCSVDNDEIAAALETLADSIGENVNVDYAIIFWQVISFLLKQRGGRLPKRYRL